MSKPISSIDNSYYKLGGTSAFQMDILQIQLFKALVIFSMGSRYIVILLKLA